MPVNKECIICHKQFTVPPVREKTARTCSKKCMGKLKSISGKQMVAMECENCHKTFKRFRSRLVGKRNFCSRKCANEGKTICIFECEVCHKVFHRPVKIDKIARFCSKKCAYQQLKIERNPINAKCCSCGKEMHVNPYILSQQENVFCSFECNKKYKTMILKDIPIDKRIYSASAWRTLRIQIIKRDNFTCQDCGIKPDQTRKLQVHHIKRRKDGGTDTPDNLLTLCFSCHKKADGRLY